MPGRPQSRLNVALQVRRIEALYNRATPAERAEGLKWYANAHAFATDLASRHGLTVRQTAGIIAALSPQISWEMNQRLAADLCAGRKLVGALGANIAKARRIKLGEDPADVLGYSEKTGKKVRAFFECLADPLGTDSVCIDRHAFDLAEGILQNTNQDRGNLLRRVGVYEAVAQAYVQVSERLGLRPHQVQAVTWVCWRNLKREINSPDVPVYFAPSAQEVA